MNNNSGHRALRKGRHSQPGAVYLVTFATADRHPWFVDFHLACAVCRTFAPSVGGDSATLLGWVLMPDHFHGLIQLGNGACIGRIVRRLKATSTFACHAQHIDGRIWARAFHDHALRADEDLRAAARYIVANPVRAGLAECVFDYPFWDAVWA